jgi:prepilin-type N-terminal cleavage/methylation domain-containing protein
MDRQNSFTLIELLVVIAIVGILAGVISVYMSGATDSANLAKAKVFANSMRDSMGQSIISEWNFDELTTATNGASIRDSWGGNTATLASNDSNDKLKTESECVYGKCLIFDGSGDNINCGTYTSLSPADKNLTFSLWVNPTEIKSNIWYNLISKGWSSNGAYLVTTYNNDTRFYMKNSDGTSYTVSYANSFYAGKWHYIVASYDDSTKVLRVYVNGKKAASNTTASGTLMSFSSNIVLGNNFVGYMDEVRFYNSVLSISQVNQQYYAGLQKLLASNQITKQEYTQKLADLNNYCIAQNSL